MAATALAPKGAVKLLSTVMPVTLSRFWMEAGMPTPHTPLTMSPWKVKCFGWMRTKVLPRRTHSRTKKYRQATQLEMQVARPAPVAPMWKPQGRIKMGSRMMLSRHPLMVPMLAWREAPSERTK